MVGIKKSFISFCLLTLLGSQAYASNTYCNASGCPAGQVCIADGTLNGDGSHCGFPPTPAPTCTPYPTNCTCGPPPSNDVNIASDHSSANSINPYADSCGNITCTNYYESCGWSSGGSSGESTEYCTPGQGFVDCSSTYANNCPGTAPSGDGWRGDCSCGYNVTGGSSAGSMPPSCATAVTPTPTPTPASTGCTSCATGEYFCQVRTGNCGGLASQTYCASDASCNGIQDVPSCLNGGQAYYFTAIPCNAGGGGNTPTPSPSSPTPTATPSCLDNGGVGRQCSGAGDINCTACGNVCAIVGDQPVKTSIGCADGDQTCVDGVNWATGYPSNGLDILLTGPAVSSNLTVYTGPTMMCVNGANTPPWTLTASTPNPLALLPAASANSPIISYDPRLMTWNGSYEVCSLQSNDLRRSRNGGNPSATNPIVGCSCMTGYEPATVTYPGQFGEITYNIHLGNPSLDTLWENVMEAMKDHPKVKLNVEKVAFQASEVLPEAFADSCGAFTSNCSNDGIGCSGFGLCGGTCVLSSPGNSCPHCVITPCSGNGGSTPTPSPACTPTTTTCTCGAPPSSVTVTHLGLGGVSENSSGDAVTTSNYPDSCGNNVCVFGEQCSWMSYNHVVPAPPCPSDPTGQNYEGCFPTKYVSCGSHPTSTYLDEEWTYSHSYSTQGGGQVVTTSCSGSTPTPTTTPVNQVTPTPTATAYPTITPTPIPGASPTPANLYVDSGSPLAKPLYLTTPQLTTPIPTPADSSHAIACVRTCPVDPNGVWTATRNQPPLDPVYCTCSTGYTFDKSAWTCTACPTGATMVNGSCQCPQGYSAYNNACMPNPPTQGISEYTQNAQGYPTCGQGTTPQNYRMPTTYGLQIAPNSSGTSTPRTTDVTTIVSSTAPNTYAFSDPYTNSAGVTYPKYQYADYPHCACMGGGSYAGSPIDSAPISSGVPNMQASGTGGDTLDVVAAFDSTGLPKQKYGMVAMALNGTSDGRNGSNFASASSCACPNINEYPKMNPSVNGFPGGVTCQPVFNDPNRVLATFNPKVDDLTGKTQVFTRTNVTGLPNIITGGYTEPLNGASVVATVSLPASQSAPTQLAAYNRHIWKCQIGYTLNLGASPPTCVWGSANNDHQCNSTSPFASDAKSAAAGVSWASIINKKLACCMNDSVPGTGSTATSGDVKFDCIDNSAQLSDFNTLWASSDSASDGGEMNAMILASADGKPLTGFYTLDGGRCNEFSEFDPAGIHPGTVNAGVAGAGAQIATVSGTFQSGGATITPPSSSLGFGYLQNGFAGAKKNMVAPHPETGAAADILNARRCPILVRAALVASCPAITTGQNAVKYTVTGTASASGATRCPVADHIRVHIRAEQVFTIAGSPAIQPTDTVVDNKDASAVSISNIIRQKNGSVCLPGMVSGTNGCHY